MTGADTPTPSFASTTAGTYRLSLTVIATDGQTATGSASILVRPPAGWTYVYLASDPGDYIGAGTSYLYTPADSSLSVSASGGHLAVGVTGDEWWNGDFAEGSALGALAPGLNDQLTRYPFNDPARGGLDWSGEGRGCNTLTGWFVVDAVTYSGSTLTSIDLRFEQHCEGAPPALHGEIHWYAGDTTQPPGPVAPPAGLWQPAAGVTPATGSYVYLASDPGDYVGAGQTMMLTPASGTFTVTGSGAHLAFSYQGIPFTHWWYGDFQGMSSLAQLQPGYYGDLERYPFHNPVRGGLSWDGDGRGCNTLTGWFVIDAITYSGPTVTAVDLRFEQHCEGMAPALHGQLHWTAAGP